MGEKIKGLGKEERQEYLPYIVPKPIHAEMTSRLILFLALCGLVGCAQSSEPDGTSDSVRVDTLVISDSAFVPSDTLIVADSVAAFRAFEPDAPIRMEGACPFECCVYTTWTTTGETTVFAEADNIHSSSFTVSADTELEADRGHVTVRRVGRVFVEAEIAPDRFWGLDVAAPGDTLYVLDYIGEGHFHFWLRGDVHEGMLPGAPDAWTEPETEELVWIEQPITEWWAHVTLDDGREGWLWMEHTPQVYGADACG